jgi:1-phosphofructokinase
MIVTLTANPSLDRTVALPGPLQRGQVQRALTTTSDPGGKGVNVARVVTAAGQVALALLPGQQDDPLVLALRDAGVTHRTVPISGRVRVNLTLTEPDGTTTKVNEPGEPLDADVLAALTAALVREAAASRWAVLSGSLPPGVPLGWYAELVARLRGTGAAVALDTSGAPLLAALAEGVTLLPDLLKPNGEELAELTGQVGRDLEGDLPAAVEAASSLLERGAGAVLATLGAAGALLVTPQGSWSARPPRIRARSSVGAGDSALAGYLLADLAGAPPALRLRSAVAYGAAAAALPGSTLPTPLDVDLHGVVVTRLPDRVQPVAL